MILLERERERERFFERAREGFMRYGERERFMRECVRERGC